MGPNPKPPAERFWSKVQKTDTCWIWIGALDSNGYGNFGLPGGRTIKAHRWAYIDACGTVPKGLHLDHLCRKRRCVRPSHLEPVAMVENLRRGDTSHRGQWQRNRTVCPANHPYDETNTHLTKEGRRMCRACNRERQRERRNSGNRQV